MADTSLPEEIRRLLEITREKPAIGEITNWLAIGIPLLCLATVVIESTSYLWRPITVILYSVFALVGIGLIELGNPFLGSFVWLLFLKLIVFLVKMIFVGLSIVATNPADSTLLEWARKELDKVMFDIDRRNRQWEEWEETIAVNWPNLNFAHTILGAIAILISFSQFLRHLSILIGGFSYEHTTFWYWLRFGFSNFLEALLFDIPSIYEWHMSGIRAVSGWGRFVVFVFRTSIEFWVVAAILHQVNMYTKAKTFSQKQFEPASSTRFFSLLLPKPAELLKFVLYGVPLIIGVTAMLNGNFSIEAIWSFLQAGGPIFMGIWLIFGGFRGLLLPGCLNKICAGTTLAVGVGMVWKWWPLFRPLLHMAGYR